MSAAKRWFVIAAPLTLVALALVALACAGGGSAPTAAPAPQQPAAAAQPAPAAPAQEPQSAAAPAPRTAPAPAPRPGAPAAPAVKEPKYGGIPIFANPGDPVVAWDPMKTDTNRLHHLGVNVYGSGNLVKMCREDVFKLCPGLAVSWEPNSDFTQWTFKIRDGALWHDGKPFTPEDARFWGELAAFGAKSGDKTRTPAIYTAQFGDLKKVEVLEGNRVRFTLGSPQLQYPFMIADPRYSTAHPKHLMQPRIEKGEVNVAPQDIGWVATGPFKVTKFEKGSLVQLRGFDKYWEKDAKGRQLPYLDGIDFTLMSDAGAFDAAFRVGRLEGGFWTVSVPLTKERQASYIKDLGDKVWFAEVPGPRNGMGFNVLKPGPWQDVRVRKAMSLWWDREAAREIRGGFALITAMLAPENPFTSPDFLTWPGYNRATREQDRAEAKRLMAAAGYAGGFTMELPCRRLLADLCELAQGQFGGLGVNIQITLMDDATFIARARTTIDYPFLQGGVAAYATIPEATEESLGSVEVTPYSVVKHRDPKVAEFYKRLNSTASFDERVRVWRELERYIMLDQVYIIITHADVNVTPYRSHVKGVVVPGDNKYASYDYAAVWLDK